MRGASTYIVRFSGGCPLQAVADGRRDSNRSTDWGSLISMGMMNPQRTRGQMTCLTGRNQGASISIMSSKTEEQMRSFDPRGIG